MKRKIILVFSLVFLLGLSGCNNITDTSAQTEVVSADYGKVIDLAEEEFADVFNAFENIQIEETSTMTRTDDAKEIVVQFKFSSSNGNGVYGFLYSLNDYANPELMQHGEDISIDNLLISDREES